ncbi:MAG: trypsin-like peptidase domain-containing protein [Planctomycetes bacterium]|nr:trypsin-like peptidase domain-containing protein [Planctomycetota bacterium]
MSRPGAIVLLLFCSCMTRAAEVDPGVLRAEADRVAVIERASRATITVLAQGGRDGGSGVIISADGYALTNFHVTEAAGVSMKCGLNDGKLYDTVLVGLDPVGDVALIKLFGRDDFPIAPLADSDQVRVGDEVFTAGNPFMLANDFGPSIAWGIISGIHRYQHPAGTLLEYADCLQTDAAINPGNSGGPLFSARGEVVGINGRGSFEKRGRVNVGVGYAISINQIKNFLGVLRSGRIVDHATLGARVGGDEQGRVIVSDILEDSDVYRRGLRYGDEIVRFGGREINSVNALKNVLGIYPNGWSVPMTYRRKGQLHDIVVRLASVHHPEELVQLLEGAGNEKKTEPKPDGPQPAPKDAQPKQDEPERKPKRPSRAARREASKSMPPVVREHYQAKRGYANYFYNLDNRSRVWQSFVARGNFIAATGAWTLTGRWVAKDDTTIRLEATGAQATLPGGQVRLADAGNLTAAEEPAGSGGMLAALYVWRQLLVTGPEKLGDTIYVGQEPVGGREPLADVLLVRYGGAETRALFDPSDGRLVRLEFFANPDADPCELTFGDYELQNGRYMPRRIEVRHADRVFAEFTVTRYELTPGGGK